MSEHVASPESVEGKSSFGRTGRFFRETFSGWRENEGVALGFTAKALLASALALWLGFRLDLENPRWSVVSIFIVMQPDSGPVLEKGFYRILATLLGCVVSVAMVAAFSQYAELFLGVLALWLGLCVACSLRFRNYQAYAWVLAGYTVTIVGLPAAFGNPDGAFASAVARATEISIGVACAGLVGALVFPRGSRSRLRALTQAHFAEFLPFALRVFGANDDPVRDLDAQGRLLDGLAAQDSAMSAAAFENPHHPDFVIRIRRLNRSFIRLTTRIHLIFHLRRRLRARGDTALAFAVESQSAMLPAGPGTGASDLRAASERMLKTAPKLAGPLGSGAARTDFATHTELLSRYLEELAAHVDAFDSLETPLPDGDPGEAPYVTTRIDAVLAAIVGARATLTVAALSLFWIGTEWPDGVMAVMCAMIAYALCASSPKPVAMMWQAFAAFLVAVPAGVAFRFFLMPEAHHFAWLFMAISPFLAFSAYLIARPKWFLFGLFFSVWFLTLAGPENNPEPDLSLYLGQSLAGAGGIALALAITALVMPRGGRWVRRRERREIRGLVVAAALSEEPGYGARFDHESRACSGGRTPCSKPAAR